MEIERKDTIISSEYKNLFFFILHKKFRLLVKNGLLTRQSYHCLVEISQISVSEIVRLSQRPLSSGMFVRPVVSLTREVDPLRVAELVTHEGKVTVAAGSHCHQTDHLMKGHTSVHYRRLGFLIHRGVHLGIHEAERDGLVSHHCLVVALGIADGLFVLTLVGELPPYLSHTPLIVREFLDPFDPIVRNSHAHSEVEADAAHLERSCQSGHSADILGDGECIRIDLADEHIGQCKVGDGIFVDALIEIIVIADEGLFQTVVPVEHACDSVEAESIDMIFLHPVFAVREEEIFGFVLAVVEAARAPGRMMSLPSVIEIESFGSVEESETFSLIVHRVRVNDVHYHCDAQSVSFVHKGLELFRSAKTGTEGIEIGHLIAERSIVRMFLEGHYLEGVISQIGHLRQHIQAEFLKCSDLFLFRCHTDMAFIDKRMSPLAGSRVLPFVFFERIPYLGTEGLGNRVLDGTCQISRKSLCTTAFPLDVKFVQGSVFKEHCRKDNLPVSASQRLQSISFSALPVIELTYQIYLRSIGCPLAEYPVALAVTMQAIVHMIVHCLGQRSVHREPVPGGCDHLMSLVNGFPVRHKPFIVIIDHCLLNSHIYTYQLFIESSFSLAPRR